MTKNDNIRRVTLLGIAAIILSFIILPLLIARFEQEIIQFKNNKNLWFALIIIRLIIIISIILWASLNFYFTWIYNNIDKVEQAFRLKFAISVMWWTNIIILSLIIAEFLVVFFHGSHRIVLFSIEHILIGILFGWFLLYTWDYFRFFGKRPLNHIFSACLSAQHERFVKSGDFDKAYFALLKACENRPDGIWFWCKLALFCERTRKNSAEADKYMANAGELITSNKVNNISEKASYFDYLGSIYYDRGEKGKCFASFKQAIEIEPSQKRKKAYEESFLEMKNNQ
jgi:tetratricopeptide (TPR) repeat protein